MDKRIDKLIKMMRAQEGLFGSVELTPDDAAELITALVQAHQYSKKRDEENQDLMLTIGRLRVEREQLESAPNSMMQLSNELAEMKRGKLAVKLPDWWANEYMEKCLYYKDVVECIEAHGITVEGSE